jgi:hypothetical protein
MWRATLPQQLPPTSRLGCHLSPGEQDFPANPSVRIYEPYALVAFLRRSIVDPNAYISPGYPKDVMPHGFAKKLSKRRLADVVAFLGLNSAG